VKLSRSVAVLFAFTLALWAIGAGAYAGAKFGAHAVAEIGALLLVQTTTGTGADEAAALVRAASGGRILSVRPDNKTRPAVYYVKVLLDGGRVRVYLVDANSGQILP
jgi:hypothetical protein